MKLLIVLVLALLSSQAVFGAYCPHRPEQNCDMYWAQGNSGSSNEAFWGLYSCQARGYPASPGSPCYDTSMLKDLVTADPGLPQVRATPDLVEPSSNQKHLDDRTYYWMQDEGSMAYWTELEREASINKPRTSNWGQVGHIAVLQTGSGQPFLINHGYLPFKRSLTPVDGSGATYQEHVTEELAPEATWSVCETDDCSVTSQPRLFAEESEDENWSTARHALPSYFNWNPCGQSSSVHLWVEGENLLTFVGVGSRTTWSDSRVVLGQCVDAVCSDVRIIPLGFNRGLPAVEHQCLGGFSGVGARIVVGSDGNPSVMWRNKFDPTQIVYIHCLDSACSTHATPSFFSLENENMPALWWDLTASERGIWLVTLNSAANTTNLPPSNTLDNSTTTAYLQITSCDDTSCDTYGSQFPSQANIVIDDQSVDNEWQWSTNNNDVAWAASAYSLGLSGDGYPLWVGQVERGPQSPLSWVVCSCRDNECHTPVCHFIADSNSILDPALVQCANLDTAEHPSYLRSSVRLRVLGGSSDGLPVITQQISSVCVEITPLPFTDDWDSSQLSRLARTLQQFNSEYSPISNRISTTTQRKVLLQSQKTTYVHCLDATCSEAAVSAAESPKVSSVSHESGYNQVDSTFLANDKIVTIYSPDATSNEQSFSWTQGCAYEFTEIRDNFFDTFSSTTFELLSTVSGYSNSFSETTPYDWDADGNLLLFTTGGVGCPNFVQAFSLADGAVYGIGFNIDFTTGLAGAPTNVVGISSDHATGIVTVIVSRYSGDISGTNQTDVEYYSYTLDQYLESNVCQNLEDPRFPSYTIPNCYGAAAGMASIQGGISNAPYFLTGASCSFTATGGNTDIFIRAARYDDFAWTVLLNPVPGFSLFREVAYDYRGRRFLVSTGTDSFWLAANSEIGQFATNIGLNAPFGGRRLKVRQNSFCSLDRVSSMAGSNLNGLANAASGIPNFVVLRQYLGVTPTPRTGGIKSWITNRWSSPTGEPCQESSVAVLAPADDVVFLCSGLSLGDDQVWGSSPIAGWTRFWEWQEIGWGLRWRWQGDVQLGTDFSYLSASNSFIDSQSENFNNFQYYIGGTDNPFSLYQTRPAPTP